MLELDVDVDVCDVSALTLPDADEQAKVEGETTQGKEVTTIRRCRRSLPVQGLLNAPPPPPLENASPSNAHCNSLCSTVPSTCRHLFPPASPRMWKTVARLHHARHPPQPHVYPDNIVGAAQSSVASQPLDLVRNTSLSSLRPRNSTDTDPGAGRSGTPQPPAPPPKEEGGFGRGCGGERETSPESKQEERRVLGTGIAWSRVEELYKTHLETHSRHSPGQKATQRCSR